MSDATNIGKNTDRAWVIRAGGELRVAYLERYEELDPNFIWWDYNHDTEICEEGQEEAAMHIQIPER